MSKIYDQYRAAFANVSAWIVMWKGERAATVAMKYPRDGAGRQYAYVHWIGVPMVRGYASGYGYDKNSAAVESAVRLIQFDPAGEYADGTPHHDAEECKAFAAFKAELEKDSGYYWYQRLESAGFKVIQAV